MVELPPGYLSRLIVTGFSLSIEEKSYPLTSLIPLRSTSIGMIVLNRNSIRKKRYISRKVRRIEAWITPHPRVHFKNHSVFKRYSKNGCIQICGSLGQVQPPSIEKLAT